MQRLSTENKELIKLKIEKSRTQMYKSRGGVAKIVPHTSNGTCLPPDLIMPINRKATILAEHIVSKGTRIRLRSDSKALSSMLTFVGVLAG